MLADTFASFKRNAGTMLGIGFLLLLPGGILTVWGALMLAPVNQGNPFAPWETPAQQPTVPEVEEAINGVFVLAGGELVQSILSQLVVAAIVYKVYQDLRGRRASMAESLAVGLSRFLVILGIAILYGLGTKLGWCFLCVGHFILACMWFVTIPAATIERVGVFPAFGRSDRLTLGSRWGILGIYLIFFFAMHFGVRLISTALSFVSPLASAVAGWIGSVFLVTLTATAQATTYYHLRAQKEGVDLDQVAAVFD